MPNADDVGQNPIWCNIAPQRIKFAVGVTVRYTLPNNVFISYGSIPWRNLRIREYWRGTRRVLPWCRLSECSRRGLKFELNVADQPLPFKIYTGTEVTAISEITMTSAYFGKNNQEHLWPGSQASTNCRGSWCPPEISRECLSWKVFPMIYWAYLLLKPSICCSMSMCSEWRHCQGVFGSLHGIRHVHGRIYHPPQTVPKMPFEKELRHVELF